MWAEGGKRILSGGGHHCSGLGAEEFPWMRGMKGNSVPKGMAMTGADCSVGNGTGATPALIGNTWSLPNLGEPQLQRMNL